MPRPPKYALFKSKKERLEMIREAWDTQERIMLDENAPASVRLEASEKRLDRLIGKAPQRIEVSEDIPEDRQVLEQIRRTPEGRAAVRELVRRMSEAARPAIDVTNTEDDG